MVKLAIGVNISANRRGSLAVGESVCYAPLMGKYSQLIDRLFEASAFQQSVFDALVKADGRAFRPLVNALLKHPNADIRHCCAEILSERKKTKALPFLVEALADDDLFVRQDVLWGIANICEVSHCTLMNWLDLDYYDAEGLHAKVNVWWKLNKQFLMRWDSF